LLRSCLPSLCFSAAVGVSGLVGWFLGWLGLLVGWLVWFVPVVGWVVGSCFLCVVVGFVLPLSLLCCVLSCCPSASLLLWA
jgi:hypothetical protein